MVTVRWERVWLKVGKAVVVACLLLAPGMAMAYDVQIHGYGNQDFIMTNKTNYFDAEEGTWNVNQMALVFTANVTDDTTIWSKVFASSEKTTMEWLYVNKKLGSGFDARVGQMKLPIGIFNLIRDNRFLHLTETNPSMYSEDVDVVHENFRGVGVEYNHDWLTVEVFGGSPELEEESGGTTSTLNGGNVITEISTETEVRNLIGGRVKLQTPLSGLSIMFSASQFDEERETNQNVLDLALGTSTLTSTTEIGKEKLWIASMEYVKNDLELRAEYARKNAADEKIQSYYGEIGYLLFGKLKPYVRYDFITTDVHNKSLAANHQTDTTVGIGYQINEYVKIKAENHFINGYALVLARGDADPDDPALAERWNMFVAGVNFMF